MKVAGSFDNELLDRAYASADAAFIEDGIVRKYTGLPYMVHPYDVGVRVQAIGGSPDMIAAAFLHDTVEDTYVTIAQIYWEFGVVVGRLVEELTEVTVLADGNRKKRKAIEMHRLSASSRNAKTIKCADLISNSLDILEHDAKFSIVYMQEKADLLPALVGADEGLLHWCHNIVNEWRSR